MIDIERFAILTVVASCVFVAVLSAATTKRLSKPKPALLAALTLVVVVFGMMFSRYGHIAFQLPWWIYYGLPATLTFFLPPIALRMKTAEMFRYVPLAILMGPVIHVCSVFFVGWRYMPFPIDIPSLARVVH